MASSIKDVVDLLRGEIKSGEVLIPGDPGYEESLRRWSDTCIKPAVCLALGRYVTLDSEN